METASVCSHRSTLQTTVRITAFTVDLTATIISAVHSWNEEEIEKEMAAIAETGLQEILNLLPARAKIKSNVEYIGKACEIARKYFKVIGLEVYPMNSDESAHIFINVAQIM